MSEKDFIELDDDRHYIRLISDVFENEPNINEDFFKKNLFLFYGKRVQKM